MISDCTLTTHIHINLTTYQRHEEQQQHHQMSIESQWEERTCFFVGMTIFGTFVCRSRNLKNKSITLLPNIDVVVHQQNSYRELYSSDGQWREQSIYGGVGEK
jgi:hypothetical protein